MTEERRESMFYWSENDKEEYASVWLTDATPERIQEFKQVCRELAGKDPVESNDDEEENEWVISGSKLPADKILAKMGWVVDPGCFKSHEHWCIPEAEYAERCAEVTSWFLGDPEEDDPDGDDPEES